MTQMPEDAARTAAWEALKDSSRRAPDAGEPDPTAEPEASDDVDGS
jgi:hypothetical protein